MLTNVTSTALEMNEKNALGNHYVNTLVAVECDYSLRTSLIPHSEWILNRSIDNHGLKTVMIIMKLFPIGRR